MLSSAVRLHALLHPLWADLGMNSEVLALIIFELYTRISELICPLLVLELVLKLLLGAREHLNPQNLVCDSNLYLKRIKHHALCNSAHNITAKTTA